MTEDFSPKKQVETDRGGAGRKGKTAIGSGDDGESDQYQQWTAREGDPVAWRRPITIVCDGNLLLRFGLGILLEPIAEVVGDAACGRSAIELASRVRPELVVLDVNLDVINSVQVCTQILQNLPETRFVVYSDSLSINKHHKHLLRAGVRSFCLKSSDPRVLFNAIEHANLGEAFCDPAMAQLSCQDPTIMMVDDDQIETEIDAAPPDSEQRAGINDEQSIAEKHAKEAIERWLKHSRS